MSDIPDQIRKDLLFDLSFALRHQTFISWKKQTTTSDQVARTLVAHIERCGFLVLRWPRKPDVASYPGPHLNPETKEQREVRMARQQIHQLYLERVHGDVEKGLEPDVARDYGRKLIADIKRDDLFSNLSDEHFMDQLRSFGSMILELSSYKGRLQPVQSHALQNIWETLYHYQPQEF